MEAADCRATPGSLADRELSPQALSDDLAFSYYAEVCMESCMRACIIIIRYFPLAEREFSPQVLSTAGLDDQRAGRASWSGRSVGRARLEDAWTPSIFNDGRATIRKREEFDWTVRARPERLSALSVSHSKSILYGAFVWVRRALNSPKRRFPAPPGSTARTSPATAASAPSTPAARRARSP